MNSLVSSSGLRGKKYVGFVSAFIEAFPLSEDDDPTELTMDEFDSWALKAGFYDEVDTGNTDSVNAARNVLRGKINKGAASPAWMVQGDPFYVDVKQWAQPTLGLQQSYWVLPAAAAFEERGLLLPGKVSSVFRGRKGQLQALLDSIDFLVLPSELRIQVKAQFNSIVDTEKRVLMDLSILEQRFLELRNDLREEMKDKPQAATVLPLIENHDG